VESLFRYVAAPSPCGYLPDQEWSLEHEYVASMTPAEYLTRMLEGWRRFGIRLFRPACLACRACRSLRVSASRFRPDRSQRRVRKLNEGVVQLSIGEPRVTRSRLDLYDRYHAHQAQARGWPEHPAGDPASYADSFVIHPFPVEEWCYHLDGRLVGVGYVDALPTDPAGPSGLATPRENRDTGLSAIYFFYDPEERHRSLGTWNILCLIDEANRRGLPYVYLGYYVQGCPSMEYKRRFVPNEIRSESGEWRVASGE
jgi:arginine-tRNA-protein transferase